MKHGENLGGLCGAKGCQNPFLTAQSTQIKSVISVPIKDFIHHYPRALFNDIPRVGAHFYDIPGSSKGVWCMRKIRMYMYDRYN